ncbi:MAG: hypothetical protein A2176_02120 [Spirochaetes bacterium RBG_13_51_14]|nr:MAG: hypothetical protein A2176_02120 [Spirochaetes bacterium RBG_13_51_14]
MRPAIAIVALPVIIACAGLPRITPAAEKEKADIARRCGCPYLNGRYRLVHTIQGTLPGGMAAAMIGITVAAADTGRLRCTLMSIEGLVLLDADYDGALVINRGIGPLASPDLVMGMIRDIKLMLFRPAGAVAEIGALHDGSGICRYRTDGGMLDVVLMNGGDTEVLSYDSSSRVSRTVRFSDFRSDGIPRRIELSATGLFSYSLRLDLIEAEQVRPLN